MDCGAACLAMICKHYGIGMTLGKLRELANVTTQGATLESLARTGESLGFTTRGVQCTIDTLRGFELPLIAHWEGYHYIVVYGVSKQHVWVADPAIGFKKMSVEEFERGWSGTCLIFTPGEDMAQVAATRSPWVRFARYLVPHKKILLHLFLATFVIQILGHRAADDHPEHPGRRDRAPEREPAAPADRRPDHLARVHPAHGDDPREAGELHGPQAGLRR